MRKVISYILLFLPLSLFSQEGKFLEGRILQKDSTGQSLALAYANVYWLNNSKGVISDSLGYYKIQKPDENSGFKLVVSYIGYMPDTLFIKEGTKKLDISLSESRLIEEVVVSKNRATNIHSRISVMNTHLITETGLQKLACCNIGESFESNATIDVGFSDAVSGAKKIKMLGLDGKYSQFLFENIPFMRGPESGYGLSHIPGPFMESIQVSKGTSSVLNGYESTTGQINVEYKKPADTDLLFVNLFANTEGRYESNITSGWKLNNEWAGMVYIHASTQNASLDNNGDGFYDKPLMNQINFLNRWEYNPDGLMHLQFGLEVLNENRIGGQLNFNGREDNPDNLYGIDININKVRIFSKLGYAFHRDPNQSIGWINSFTRFDQSSLYGNREYSGLVNSFYSNLIWQTRLWSERNSLSSGLSFQYDNFDEFFITNDILRTEIVPGIFSQYTWSVPHKWVFMSGLRLDYNSEFGFLFTPRIHLKYNYKHDYIIRATLGKSHRSPDIFAENMNYLASSRSFIIQNDIVMEKAWNTGISFGRYFHFTDHREASLSLDFYHTRFRDQMITDPYQDVSSVFIYNLDGNSVSNVFQADFTGEIVKSLDITLAYRFNDVKVDYLGGTLKQPFTIRHKALFTSTYSTRFDKWKFDLTVQRNGKSRIPDTGDNPEEFRFEENSPAYYIVHTQITKRFKKIDLYTGIENLTGFRQKNAILDPENPFGEYFDATLIWGPLTGRMFYGGLRFRID